MKLGVISKKLVDFGAFFSFISDSVHCNRLILIRVIFVSRGVKLQFLRITEILTKKFGNTQSQR